MLDENDRQWIRNTVQESVSGLVTREELRQSQSGLATKDQVRESLDSAVASMLDELSRTRTEIIGRLDSIDARIKVHAGLLQGGSRAMARFIAFTETSERRWKRLDKRLRAVERRLNMPPANGQGRESAQ